MYLIYFLSLKINITRCLHLKGSQTTDAESSGDVDVYNNKNQLKKERVRDWKNICNKVCNKWQLQTALTQEKKQNINLRRMTMLRDIFSKYKIDKKNNL